MKTIQEVLLNNKDVYLWGDEKTLDVEVNDDTKDILNELLSFKCLLCENSILGVSSKIVRKITSNDSGAQIKCQKCQQDYFIHKPIIIPKNLDTNN